MEEKKNTRFIVIIVILVILLSCCIGYIVYDNFIKEDEIVENNDKNNDNQNNEQNDNKEDKLSEEELDELGLELFDRTNIVLTSTSGDYVFYQEDDITYDDLANKDKLEYVYRQIPNSEKVFNPNDAYDSSCIDTNTYQYTCYYEKVSTDIFEKYYHKMFGSDKSVNYEWFLAIIDNFLKCEKEENELVCYPTDAGGALSFRSYIKYNHTEQDGNDLLIYVNFLVGETDGVYSDLKLQNRLGDNDLPVTPDNIFDIYGNKAGLYKLTFKKDSNDNYYWYSSEIVK